MLQQPGLAFLASEQTTLEMLHVLISGKLVADDEFPNLLLLITKRLCMVTPCAHVKLASSLDHSDAGGSPREDAET